MYYVFLATDIPTTDSAINGFMPLKRQYGFVFKDSSKADIIAHELGHGVFGLQHYEESGTDNLLMHNTYPSGDAFTHMDWQIMHAPGLQLYIFQGDEEGESATILTRLPQRLAVLHDGEYYLPFLTPNNKRIFLPYDNIEKPSFYFGIWNNNYNDVAPGVLIQFDYINEDGTSTHFNAKIENNNFSGYYSDDQEFNYQLAPSGINQQQIVIGTPTGASTSNGYRVAKYNYNTDEYSAGGEIVKVQDLVFYPHMGNAIEFENYSSSKLEGERQTLITDHYLETIQDAQTEIV